MSDLTVVCLLLRKQPGANRFVRRAYTADYVARLRNGVARHLSLPHRFACMTDEPGILPAGVEPIPIRRPRDLSPWWAKLQLFRRKLGWSGRLLYLDLDVVPVGPLDGFAAFQAPFALLPDMAPLFEGSPKYPDRAVVHRYNSSVMALDAGERPFLWDAFTALDAARLWSDQDFIGERAPHEATFPQAWARRSNDGPPPWPPDTKVILCNKPKPHRAIDVHPWIAEHWR